MLRAALRRPAASSLLRASLPRPCSALAASRRALDDVSASRDANELLSVYAEHINSMDNGFVLGNVWNKLGRHLGGLDLNARHEWLWTQKWVSF